MARLLICIELVKVDENPLLRHLVIAVVLKLVVLTALWWAFVRDERVSIDVERAAAHLGATTATVGAKP